MFKSLLVYYVIIRDIEVIFVNFLVGTYTKHNSLGIYSFSITNNQLSDASLLAKSSSPSYLAHHGDLLFTTYSSADKGGIRMYVKGKLVAESLTHGKGPSHVSYSPVLKMAFSANYSKGELRTYLVKGDLLELHEVIDLGENSHAHQIFYQPKMNRIIVCDLGLDQILMYKLHRKKHLKLDLIVQLPTKSGPRHLVVCPKHHHLYCVAELSNQVFVYDYKNQVLFEPLTTISDEVALDQQAAAIKVFGLDLYVSNRGNENSIAHFKTSQNGLTYVTSYDSGGKHPRDFSLSADGNYLVVGNLESDNLVLFRRLEDGSLVYLDEKECLEPTAILFK